MSRQIVSRRSALRLIARTGAALGAGGCFALSLKTRPLAGAPWAGLSEGQADQQTIRPVGAEFAAESAVISGTKSTILVNISGPAGRHCAMAYAVSDSKEHYKAVPGGRGVIGKDGLCTIRVDVAQLPNQKVFLRVVTGNTKTFDEDFAGTEAFVVKIAKGVIAGFEGVKSRPLINVRSGEKGIAVAATTAAACVGRKAR
jgi:hypothetical protein